MAKNKTLYDEIKAAIAESPDGRYSESVSMAGGRERFVVWTETVTGLNGALFGNTVALLQPERMILTCAGHNTPSTVDALNHIAGGNVFHNKAGVLMFGDEPMPETLALDYDGNKVPGSSSTLAPIRGVYTTRSGEGEDGEPFVDVMLDGTGRAGKGVAASAAERYFGGKPRLVTEDGEVFRFVKA